MGTAHGVETTPKSRPSRKAPIYPCFLTLSPAGTGKFNLSNAEQVEPHQQTDCRDEILPERTDVAEHPSHKRGDEPEGREGDGQAQDEKERKDEGALERRRLLVPGDDAHQERDHGQNAGIQGRRHAAQEDGDDRQPGAVLEERGNVAEEALHLASAHWIAVLLQELEDLLLGKEPDVAGDLLALLVQEDLGRDELDAVFLGPARGPSRRRRRRPGPGRGTWRRSPS